MATTAAAVRAPERRRRPRYTVGGVVFTIVTGLVFLAFAVICAYPFYFLLINSVSANDLSAQGDVRWWPIGFHLQNYLEVFKLPGLPAAAMVSVARTVLGTVATVFASAFLGFMFTQQRMWKRQLWYRLIVITMYFNAGIIPIFLIMKTLGLTNNFWVYILPFVVAPFNIILVKTYVESLPASLQEAAEVDGANVFQIFFRIMLPSMTPILATVAIFSAVTQWNSFQDTLIYVTDQSLYTLQFVLYMYISQAASLALAAQQAGGNIGSVASAATSQTATSIQVTVAVLAVAPILFIYPLFQRFFVKGIMLGAVKG
ncbi:MAG: carbohydrate ABC transporter permease [Propionicimonas sp.]|uniref:carbohydrate ABC transporter permease n=1 Tax=Propionicimonas sp. TaxID=1955623 RepID=UPI003D0F3D4C